MKNIELLVNNNVGEKEQQIVIKFANDFWEFLEKSEFKANVFVQGDNLAVEDDEIGDLVAGMLDNIVVVSLNADLESFFKKLEKEKYFEDINLFIQFLQGCVEERAYAAQSIGFFKETNWEKLKKAIEHCFERYILITNSYEKSYDDFSREQLEVIVKVAFTLIEMIIVYNYSYETAKEETYRMFVWKEEVFEIFWDLIEKNRECLWKNAMMQKLLELDKKVSRISNEIYHN